MVPGHGAPGADCRAPAGKHFYAFSPLENASVGSNFYSLLYNANDKFKVNFFVIYTRKRQNLASFTRDCRNKSWRTHNLATVFQDSHQDNWNKTPKVFMTNSRYLSQSL